MRRASWSGASNTQPRAPLDPSCRPVLCIRGRDCRISLESNSGDIDLKDVENCVSGGPLETACDQLLAQFTAFSDHLYGIASRDAQDRVSEIRFWGNNSDYKVGVVWRYDRHEQGRLPPKVIIESRHGFLSMSRGEVYLGAAPRTNHPRRITWTTLLARGVAASAEDIDRAELIVQGMYRSGVFQGAIDYISRGDRSYLRGTTLRYGKMSSTSGTIA